MKVKNTVSHPVFSAFLLILVISCWILFAPSEVGGQTTYIILIGNSMEPRFHINDLVLVRTSREYRVNDIVAYKQPDVGIVFHRIRQSQNGYFVMKGDHNSWEDSYHPTAQEVVGKLWMRIPKVGLILTVFRTPIGFTFLVIIITFLLLFFIFSDWIIGRKQRNKTNSCESGFFKINHKDKNVMDMDNKFSDFLYIIFAIFFAAFFLAIASFSSPIESSKSDDYEFFNYGTFSYSSEVPDDIYDNETLNSGDPIYRQINDRFIVSFTYELKSEMPITAIEGTYQMVGIISEASGWEKTIQLTAPALINIKKFTSSAEVNLNIVQSVIDNFEEQTGITSNRYTLTIQPQVNLACKIGGRKVKNVFTPEFQFSMDDQKLVLIQDNSKTATDILNPTQVGVAAGFRKSANTLSILGLKINVLLARIISVYLIVAVIIAGLWFSVKNGYLQLGHLRSRVSRKVFKK